MPKVHEIINKNDVKELEILLARDKSAINQVDDEGRTPLILALIRLGEARNFEKAEEHEDYRKLIQFLFHHKALNLNLKNKASQALPRLFVESMVNEPEKFYMPFIDLMINASPKVVIELFHAAIFYHNLNLVEYLLARDPDLIKIKDARGFSPYQICLASSATEIEDYFYRKFPKEIASETQVKMDVSTPLTPVNIIKRAITYEDPKLKSKFEMILEELYANPAFRPTLNLLAASLLVERSYDHKTLRIFVADADNVRSLTPQSSGFGDLDPKALILRIGGLRDKKELKGSLIHEFTHLAALLACANGCIPCPDGSTDQKIYEQAIREMLMIDKFRTKLTDVDRSLGDLFVGRIVNYASVEERAHLKSGSLTLPEWIAGIPQAFVLYGEYYESSSISSIETRGAPMMRYWLEHFNRLVEEAFEVHPLRKHVNTMVPVPEISQRKSFLTISSDSLQDFLVKQYRLELDSHYEMVEGFNEGHIAQARIAHQILCGLHLKMALDAVPREIALIDARALLENPLFLSADYNDAFKQIYNALTEVWMKKGKPNIFTLDDIQGVDLSKIERNFVTSSLQDQINMTMSAWAYDIRERVAQISKCVEKAIELATSSFAISKKYLTNLTKVMIHYLYLRLPRDQKLAVEKLQALLISFLQTQVLQPVITVSGIFSEKKGVKIKLDESTFEKLDLALASLIIKDKNPHPT